jgi:hypothetical protein
MCLTECGICWAQGQPSSSRIRVRVDSISFLVDEEEEEEEGEEDKCVNTAELSRSIWSMVSEWNGEWRID